MQTLTQDLKYALRQLRKSPGFAITALLTLALGIGASSVIFTIVNSVLLRPLDYSQSGQLVVIWEKVANFKQEAGPNLRQSDAFANKSSAFQELTWFQHQSLGVSTSADHPRVTGVVVAKPNLLHVLGVRPLLGRDFGTKDALEGRNHIALISYGMWQTMFHGETNVIGKTFRLADVPTEIVGVLPKNFQFPASNVLNSYQSEQASSNAPAPEVITPLVDNIAKSPWMGEFGNYVTLGRLKPDMSLTQASTQLQNIVQQYLQDLPPGEKPDNMKIAIQIHLEPMQEAIVGDASSILWLLLAAVMGVLLIACLNLANTQLARAALRQKEAAVRTALGASQWNLLSSYLMESVLLAFTGGLAGIGLAFIAIQTLRSHPPITIPRLAEIQINTPVIFFTFALSVGAILLFGLLPALRLMRQDPQSALQQASVKTAGSSQHKKLHSALITAQVFGCTTLLLVTGLFAKSLLHLLTTEKGFQTEHISVAQVNLPVVMFDKDDPKAAEQVKIQKKVFLDSVLEKLRSTPGIQSAGAVSAMPLEGESWISAVSDASNSNAKKITSNMRWASSGYFETMHHPLVAGRYLDGRDSEQRNIVISESLAKAIWPNQDAIGRHIDARDKENTVVGVIADSHSTSLKSAPAAMVYFLMEDRPPSVLYFVVRGSLPTEQMNAAIRNVIWNYNSSATIARIKTMDSQLDDSLASERLQTFLLILFGASALFLAMLGIYGVLSYAVASRTKEIGVRIALGASRSNIYSITFNSMTIPVLAGLGGGLLASFLIGRYFSSSLFGVKSGDPTITLSVTAAFLLAAVASAFLPARRATHIEPMTALRID